MVLPILAGLAGKIGTDVVGKVMEKTLPKAMDFFKASMKAPFDAFESVMNIFGGKPSKTPPAQQFSLPMPRRSAGLVNQQGGIGAKLKQLASKLSQLANVFSKINEVLDMLKGLLGVGGAKGGPIAQAGGAAGGGGMTGTGAVGQASGTGFGGQVQQAAGGSSGGSATGGIGGGPQGSFGPSSGGPAGGPGGVMADQWKMFNYMQQCQKASEMFEMAVKVAEMRHQAAMSAIRAIRY